MQFLVSALTKIEGIEYSDRKNYYNKCSKQSFCSQALERTQRARSVSGII